MYETNFILKPYANKKYPGGSVRSVISKVKLTKPIYGAKYFKLIFFFNSASLTTNSTLRCDLTDESLHFCFCKDNPRNVTTTDMFLVTNSRGNHKSRKVKISDSKSTINEFEVESEFTSSEKFNADEIANSFFQITIHHTEY